jgi:poly(hydroxyalkanoate) depolymerase family esterase
MRYLTRRRAALTTACALLVVAPTLRVGPARAASSGGSLTTKSYSNGAGTLNYELYVPAGYTPGTAVPLVVALHGCTQTADVFRKLTGFDKLADQKNFIVAFPEQSSSNNYMSCWNWFQDSSITRGASEPTLIAGITAEVQKNYTIDTRRTYVTGLSAGGAMANVMAATYPDVYAAVGSGSGCEYTAGAACAGYQSADPETAEKNAYKAMGSHARAMPWLVFQGDKDTTVPPVNADQAVQTYQILNDLADDGVENGSVPKTPYKTVDGTSPGGESYTVKYYSDGHGNELGEYWTVHGMNHAWSGGDASQQYSDPDGPDESAAMYAYFMAHAMGNAGTGTGTGGGTTGTGSAGGTDTGSGTGTISSNWPSWAKNLPGAGSLPSTGTLPSWTSSLPGVGGQSSAGTSGWPWQR